jgi:hypothetical protein
MTGPNVNSLKHVPLCRHAVMKVHLELLLVLIKGPSLLDNEPLKPHTPQQVNHSHHKQNIRLANILRIVFKDESLDKEVGDHHCHVQVPLVTVGEESQENVPQD